MKATHVTKTNGFNLIILDYEDGKRQTLVRQDDILLDYKKDANGDFVFVSKYYGKDAYKNWLNAINAQEQADEN